MVSRVTSYNIGLMCLCTIVLYCQASSIIIELHPQAEGLTCWTCPNKPDNKACNDWAPDHFCHKNATMCKTVHLIEVASRRSISVTKYCTSADSCTHMHIGCHSTGTPGLQECVSCCNHAYCNEAVPVDHSTALALSSIPHGASSWVKPSTPILTLTLALGSSWIYLFV